MFAKRMQFLESSGIRKMFELASKMNNPINLSLGQPDFDVPEPVKEAAIKAIRDGKNSYTVTAGIPQLREAIMESLVGEGVKVEAVMGTSGASGGLALALFALADEDVEVLVPDPAFVTYGHLIRLVGSQPKWIDTYPDFRLTPERLEAAVTKKNSILLFNSPVNPTGIAYRPDEIKALAKTCKRLGVRVICDEIYDRFCYDYPHECWLKHDPTAILVRGFSKSWGMPGWRAGYVAGPSDVLDQMITLQQFTFVCVHAPTQWAAIEALKTDVSELIEKYRVKRAICYEGLKQAFNLSRPEGAFYAFPEAPGGDMDAFMKKCIEKEILIVPGKAFSQRNTHFRVSYAVDDEILKRGVDGLVDLARS